MATKDEVRIEIKETGPGVYNVLVNTVKLRVYGEPEIKRCLEVSANAVFVNNKQYKLNDTKRCPDCGNTHSRPLECEEHGKDCPLIVCVDCGSTIEDLSKT